MSASVINRVDMLSTDKQIVVDEAVDLVLKLPHEVLVQSTLTNTAAG